MALQGFTEEAINDCLCYRKGAFLIVQNKSGAWNAYRGGASIKKNVIGASRAEDRAPDGNIVMMDIAVLGPQEYHTPEAAAVDCV